MKKYLVFLFCSAAFGAVTPVSVELYRDTNKLKDSSTDSSGIFTDLPRAPAGAPLTICGRNFGPSPRVTIGGKSVTLLDHAASKNPRNDCLRVKAERSGVVSVNDVAGPVFNISSGSVLYVSLSGNDSLAVKNDPAKPWRHLQGSSELSGAIGAASAGDVIVLRGGDWSDVGYEGRWARLLTKGNLAIVSYPGEDVHYSGNSGGGIHGPDDVHAGKAPGVTISGLRIEGASNARSDGAPINLQYGANGWRVINDDLSWSKAPGGMKAGGIVGNGNGVSILGNNVHDISGGTENHGMYLDGGGGYDIGYNRISNLTGGNLFQIYDDWDASGVSGVKFHDNELMNGARYGLNLSTQTVSFEAWSNTIDSTALAAVRISVDASKMVDLWIHDNLITKANTLGSGSSRGAVNCDWNLTNATRALIEKNSISAGRTSALNYEEYGSCPALKFNANTWAGGSGAKPH